MIKDVLRIAVMLSVLLFAMFAFFAFVAFILHLLEILPQYVGNLMTALLLFAIFALTITMMFYIKNNKWFK